jgi:hypothetical protein
VLAQALVDAQNVHQSERCRSTATAFLLEPGEVFTFWAHVAGLSPELVRQQAQRYLTRRRTTTTQRLHLDDDDQPPA